MANLLTPQEETFEGEGLGRWNTSTDFWSFEPATEVAHSGIKSIKQVRANIGQSNAGIEIRQVPGLPVSVSFWVYQSTSIQCHGYAELYYFDVGNNFLDVEYLPLGSEYPLSAWTNYYQPCSAPIGTSSFNLFFFTGRVHNVDRWAIGDTIYYDDMVVENASVTGGSSRPSLRKRQRDR